MAENEPSYLHEITSHTFSLIVSKKVNTDLNIVRKHVENYSDYFGMSFKECIKDLLRRWIIGPGSASNNIYLIKLVHVITTKDLVEMYKCIDAVGTPNVCHMAVCNWVHQNIKQDDPDLIVKIAGDLLHVLKWLYDNQEYIRLSPARRIDTLKQRNLKILVEHEDKFKIDRMAIDGSISYPDLSNMYFKHDVENKYNVNEAIMSEIKEHKKLIEDTFEEYVGKPLISCLLDVLDYKWEKDIETCDITFMDDKHMSIIICSINLDDLLRLLTIISNPRYENRFYLDSVYNWTLNNVKHKYRHGIEEKPLCFISSTIVDIIYWAKHHSRALTTVTSGNVECLQNFYCNNLVKLDMAKSLKSPQAKDVDKTVLQEIADRRAEKQRKHLLIAFEAGGGTYITKDNVTYMCKFTEQDKRVRKEFENEMKQV